MESSFADLRRTNMMKNVTGASREIIERVEQELSIRFSMEYKMFLREIGAYIGREHEIVGICDYDDMNVLNTTKENQSMYSNIPRNWYVIEIPHINSIVIWQDENGAIYQTMSGKNAVKVASSLFEYLNDEF